MHIASLKAKLKQRVIVPAIALSMIASFGAYEIVKPAVARAAVAPPTLTPLDDNSVSPLVDLDRAMETLAARVTPAIVNVTVTSKTKVDASEQQMPDIPGFGQFFGHPTQPQSQIEHGLGSGVIISPDGYIVTNNHVINGAVDIHVTMSDRRIMPAKLMGADPLTDLAVIKVDGKDLPSLPFGDSTKLRPGQAVLAFGNPFGFRFTVTRGIVSALNRPNPDSDRRKPGEFIQTDAAINPGNSGGPLVDVHGEVVGINTFLISESGAFSGMGFAIPTQVVRPTVDQLMRDGKVHHAYMGVGITDVTPENAKFFHVNNASGAVVSQVDPNTPGAKAGLKVGDVITRIDGREVSDAGQLQVEVGQQQPGTTIHLDVMRDGKNITVPVTVAELGKGNSESADAHNPEGKARWGLAIADLNSDVRDQIQAPSELHGAVIERVQPGSPADNAGLAPGEVIQQVNHQDMHSAQDVQQALSKIPNGQDALVLVWGNGGSTFRVLHSGDHA